MPLGSPEAARRAASSILAEGRFHQPPVPNPLHGVLVWVGRVLSDPLDAVGRLVTRIGDAVPGGVAGAWVVAALVLITAVGLLALRRARTRLGHGSEPTGRARRLGPSELEREAVLAEGAGRWEDAVRLRFRAGILRLGERLSCASTETTPNQVIGEIVHSARFDSLAARFDEVAYGGRRRHPQMPTSSVASGRSCWSRRAGADAPASACVPGDGVVGSRTVCGAHVRADRRCRLRHRSDSVGTVALLICDHPEGTGRLGRAARA